MLEAATSDLVAIWFIGSGLVSLVISIFFPSFVIEFTCFVILGVVLMVCTKPFIKKSLKLKNAPTNLDRVVGMKGKVTEDITPDSIGEVYVDGKKWSAIAEEKIEKGEIVTILKIDGVKLKVRKENK